VWYFYRLSLSCALGKEMIEENNQNLKDLKECPFGFFFCCFNNLIRDDKETSIPGA
jgi:hypothetical protein